MTDTSTPLATSALAEVPTLSVKGLYKEFRIRGRGSGTVIPVNEVSFDIPRGTTTALVGESGSGKSTLSRIIMGLYTPERGTVELDGQRISGLSARRLRPHRADFQMVFQNPLLSFDPMFTIGTSIREVMRLSADRPTDPDAAIGELLDSVGLSPAFASLRPRGVSGGELQRAAIARAVSAYPKLLVLDEPTSALDVSIQGQVLALLEKMQKERGMAYLMATHDLKVVRLTSHQVIVLYRGRVVERASTTDIFADARHPYTISLLAAEHGQIAGESTVDTTHGDGCPVLGGDCPEPQHLEQIGPDRWVRCWRHYDGPGKRSSAQPAG